MTGLAAITKGGNKNVQLKKESCSNMFPDPCRFRVRSAERLIKGALAMAGMNRRPASLGLGLLVLWCSGTVLTWLVPSNSPDRSLLAGSQLQRGRQQSKLLRMAVGWMLERAMPKVSFYCDHSC